ncbi:hypothetical protein BAJUN_02190 [Bajunvirus bajun]|uniref:Uncharacterized protein n=1 Tax=Brevundimonas phage vB_BgoS-Bajun TaxID=2948594 RepID=A0A9E7N7L2_9CAUD|nr:hypothetical protein BAJUN_02190 [Brevundimonas phage vB_BgoS-Bajun]
MQLPTWIPRISRPWNPAYRSTWDVMSDNEKRWSWLFDAGVVLVVGIVLLVLSRQ